MSASYLNNLSPDFKATGSSNFFTWDSSLPDNGADTSIGYDIDGAKYNIRGNEYGDYDQYVQPHLSAGETIVPAKQDIGPSDYVESEENDGNRYYNLKTMLDMNTEPTVDDMIVINNGRVGDASQGSSRGPFNPGADLTMVHDNKESSIRGILDENAVNSVFFSDMNVKVLNDAMRYGVYQKTNQVIGPQSQNELYIIMRSIMLQFANFQAAADKVIEEVKMLNQKVLTYCIDIVSSNVLQQKKYLEDIETLPVPIDRPQYVEHPKNLTYDISNLL
uniref:Minor capsid protein P8 central region domain-containing protein n=1 Tax=viral metagenome TaxID=1070528 RepID=A0A6C0F8Q3_9ZZZZ|tara:strand:- start:312 stop:1139 length:828 start_codon:yes stop_codon:yes gene_type:complete